MMERTAAAREKLDSTREGYESKELRRYLNDRMIGQSHVVPGIIEVYQRHLAGMSNPRRPIGSFLFLGPTGTGKTRMVEAVAESLHGTSDYLLRVDCAEFQYGHEIAKLVGSPPGYLGHKETKPMLCQDALDRQHAKLHDGISIVLFDEIEKAGDELSHLLLGILDTASLTLGDNRRVDFSKTLIFMTSNLGSAEMSSGSGNTIGFSGGQARRTEAAAERIAMHAAREKFSPEFMNRVDKKDVFHALGDVELRAILELELIGARQRVAEHTQFQLDVTQGAKDSILREGADIRYGARHLKRGVESALLTPLANLLATGQILEGDRVEVDYDAGSAGMVFHRVERRALGAAAGEGEAG